LQHRQLQPVLLQPAFDQQAVALVNLPRRLGLRQQFPPDFSNRRGEARIAI